MKRIAIFCDGTWNGVSAPQATNVMELARAVEPTDAQDVQQQSIYIEGVGTGNTSLLSRTDKIIGGAFGLGLLRNVRDAYKQLVFSYQPGDEIYLFGFSRGAYTARSLLGLIRSCGIIERDHVDRLDEALKLYRYRGIGSHPDQFDSSLFRMKYAGQTYVNDHDLVFRAERGVVGLNSLPKLTVKYIGVWDTVGALGVPNYLGLARLLNGRYRFHDVTLSRMTEGARHAVAIDEGRRTFPPTLWDNIGALDAAAGGKGDYQQVWFPGDHGSVGGGGEIKGLSAAALEWVADGATDLALRPEFKEMVRDQRRVFAPLTNRDPAAMGPGGRVKAALMNLFPRVRKGPAPHADASGSTLSWEAETRMNSDELDPPYRPATLAAWHEEPATDRYYQRFYKTYGDEMTAESTYVPWHKRAEADEVPTSHRAPRYYRRYGNPYGDVTHRAMGLPPEN